MKEGRPSQTAALVAFLRALADIGATTASGFSDPTARVLLPPAWSAAFRIAERRFSRVRPESRRRIARGVDVLALRTLAVDQAVSAALERGVRQVVILGAGLDGRAFRLAGIERADVFEVDYPATQAYKRRRAAPLASKARTLRYVAVDFERDSLSAVLDANGHDASAPTFWLWEGVVTYLTDAAVRATLSAVVARSAPGSGIVITYSAKVDRSLASRVIFRAWGEPQIGARTSDAIAALVTEAGLVIEDDSGLAEWTSRFHADRPLPRAQIRALVARTERVHVGP